MFCKFVHIEIQLFKNGFQLLIATGLIAIETGTDKNAIGIVKHHMAVLPEQTMAQMSIKR